MGQHICKRQARSKTRSFMPQLAASLVGRPKESGRVDADRHGSGVHGRRHCCPRSKGPRAIREDVHGGNQCGWQELYKRNSGADDTGASLVLWDNPTDLATQWYIMDIGNGQYNILNAKSLKCVNVSRHRMNFGANVLQWDNPKSPETRFSIKTLNGGAIAIDEAVTIESCYNSGKYINAIFGHKDSGTQLLLMGEVGNWATQWIIRVANESGTSSRL